MEDGGKLTLLIGYTSYVESDGVYTLMLYGAVSNWPSVAGMVELAEVLIAIGNVELNVAVPDSVWEALNDSLLHGNASDAASLIGPYSPDAYDYIQDSLSGLIDDNCQQIVLEQTKPIAEAWLSSNKTLTAGRKFPHFDGFGALDASTVITLDTDMPLINAQVFDTINDDNDESVSIFYAYYRTPRAPADEIPGYKDDNALLAEFAPHEDVDISYDAGLACKVARRTITEMMQVGYRILIAHNIGAEDFYTEWSFSWMPAFVCPHLTEIPPDTELTRYVYRYPGSDDDNRWTDAVFPGFDDADGCYDCATKFVARSVLPAHVFQAADFSIEIPQRFSYYSFPGDGIEMPPAVAVPATFIPSFFLGGLVTPGPAGPLNAARLGWLLAARQTAYEYLSVNGEPFFVNGEPFGTKIR